MKTSPESLKSSLENNFVEKFERISFDREMRLIAEQLRDQARQELKYDGFMCENKQRLMDSIKVVPGSKKDEYLVISEGDYGKDLEFGTRNSLEKPWFTPAFVTVTRSIGNCLQGALKRALQKARRLHIRR